MAAWLFELDDFPGEVREALAGMEARWRGLLSTCVAEEVDRGQLDAGLDVSQFVWELCGIYLAHHAASRFRAEPDADRRAALAIDALFARAAPSDAR